MRIFLLSFTLFCLSTASFSQINIDSGLVAFFPFCGDALDHSGNSFHGTPQNGASLTTDAFGRANAAYDFDGIDDQILIPNLGTNYPVDELTLSFWAKADKAQSRTVFFTNPADQNNRISATVMYSHSGQCRHFFDHGDVGASRLEYPCTYDFDWHHYVFTHSSDSQEMKLYIDGTLIQTKSNSGGYTQATSDLIIGSGLYLGIHNLSFDGSIDEFRIYDRVLSLPEILLIRTSMVCSDSTSSIQIEHSNINEQVKVFPNPSNGKITFSAPGYNIKDYQIEVFNALGSSIIIDAKLDNKNTLDVAELSSGCYLIKGTSSSQVFYKKIVIQNE